MYRVAGCGIGSGGLKGKFGEKGGRGLRLVRGTSGVQTLDNECLRIILHPLQKKPCQLIHSRFVRPHTFSHPFLRPKNASSLTLRPNFAPSPHPHPTHISSRAPSHNLPLDPYPIPQTLYPPFPKHPKSNIPSPSPSLTSTLPPFLNNHRSCQSDTSHLFYVTCHTCTAIPYWTLLLGCSGWVLEVVWLLCKGSGVVIRE